jgi:hypothetical protein
MKTIPAIVALAALCAACGTSPRHDETASAPATARAPSAASNTKAVKSRDGSFVGEIVGTPAGDAKFARLQIGMHMKEARQILGRAPDQLHMYESGKRFIPFYYGNDANRMQVLYLGEGCLVFAAGNPQGGASGDELIRIENDPTGACYKR